MSQTVRSYVNSIRPAVSLAFFVNGFAIGSWTPEVPVLGERLGLTPATYGFMVLIFGLGAVVAMPVVGALIARRGSRQVSIATQALLAVSVASLIAAPHPALTAFAIFIFGVGLGGMDVAMNANAVSVERSMDRAIMSSCHGFWSLGAVAGAGIGGALIEGFGPLGHTLVVASFAALALVYIAPNMLEDRRNATPADAIGRLSMRQILAAQRTPLLLAVAIGVIALGGFVQEGVVIDWSAVYLRDELGVSLAASGFGFAAFSLTMALFRFFGDGIRERYGAVRTVRASLLIALAGLVVLILATSLPVALIGFLILGIGMSNVVPIAFSAAGNLKRLADGTGISIASAIAYSGGLIAPAIVGIVADAYGFKTIFAALATISLAIILSAGLLKRADRGDRGA
ncbi:MFS permease [Fulvimarina pelagi HTCC2506]|uniref:MFS permease n=2 Tax=Fulvimarina pelagi TaxID=217511 RepID=Q0G308_9HYPH|nr:MFS transporter [Fulvimarina pelagi]EAU42023.1 MFS permease [Fulvimarina pelagi HTCC2506]BAT30998.1 MFS permease [Fulvimarina pelagi]